MSLLKSLDNFLDCLFFSERIRQMDKIMQMIITHSDRFSVELRRKNQELNATIVERIKPIYNFKA